jgi:hypothetical protein
MPTTGYLRNFEAGVAALLDRGHRVTLAVDEVLAESQPIVHRLERRGGLQITTVAGFERAPGAAFGSRLRSALDYWRYLEPSFSEADAARKRARRSAPWFAVGLETSPAAVRTAVTAGVRHVERRLPLPDALLAFLRDCAPDVVLVTPLIYFESTQVNWVRAARRLGIPTAFAVHSWDNLTTKGTLHEMPDQVLLWNDAQRDEAVAFHGVAATRCVVTGATAFDHWFGLKPTRSRDEFVRELGLPPGRALLLYLCSSSFVAPNEATWVEQWLAALRAAPAAGVREAAVIVRPHPQTAAQWKEWQPPDGGVCVFPRRGENPVSDASRLHYFHSLMHSDAVVGLNTSGLIEAAIVEKPVLLVSRQDGGKQRRTLHLAHLERGLMSVATSTEAHVEQLAGVLAGRGGSRSREFVASFVRPLGLDQPAGVVMAQRIEQLAGRDRGRQ